MKSHITGVETLVEGVYTEDQIVISFDDKSFDPGEHMNPTIEKEWVKGQRAAAVRDAQLFDGSLTRLTGWRSDEDELELHLQRTSFKMFVGTNLRDSTLPEHSRADPMGNSAIILTADDKIILGKRSHYVYGHPGWYHFIGGHIDPDRDTSHGLIDTFKSIVFEVTEELSVREDDIINMLCIGLMRDIGSQQPEQLFTVNLRLSSAEVLARGREHSELIAIANDKNAVNRFLERNSFRTAPVAQAALYALIDML